MSITLPNSSIFKNFPFWFMGSNSSELLFFSESIFFKYSYPGCVESLNKLLMSRPKFFSFPFAALSRHKLLRTTSIKEISFSHQFLNKVFFLHEIWEVIFQEGVMWPGPNWLHSKFHFPKFWVCVSTKWVLGWSKIYTALH